jgi:serine/threonine protein kinase
MMVGVGSLLGMTLGSCHLEQLIGQGGMGAVFLAQQDRPRRQVAVKVLLPSLLLDANQQKIFLARFRREADAAASLDHGNILSVFEFGEQDGLAYLVMPLITGGTLRTRLALIRQGQPLALSEIAHYLDQAAAALGYAHQHGVVHRDVKPANFLLHADGRLLLSDFGIARLATPELGEQRAVESIGTGSVSSAHTLTQNGVIMGTPEYIAPEQLRGLPADGRADIYSLGATIYELLAGVGPFVADTPFMLAAMHLSEPPPPLLPRRPDLPAAAEQAVLRALAKDPQDRFQQAPDFAQAFRLALAKGGLVAGVSAGPPAVVPRMLASDVSANVSGSAPQASVPADVETPAGSVSSLPTASLTPVESPSGSGERWNWRAALIAGLALGLASISTTVLRGRDVWLWWALMAVAILFTALKQRRGGRRAAAGEALLMASIGFGAGVLLSLFSWVAQGLGEGIFLRVFSLVCAVLLAVISAWLARLCFFPAPGPPSAFRLMLGAVIFGGMALLVVLLLAFGSALFEARKDVAFVIAYQRWLLYFLAHLLILPGAALKISDPHPFVEFVGWTLAVTLMGIAIGASIGIARDHWGQARGSMLRAITATGITHLSYLLVGLVGLTLLAADPQLLRALLADPTVSLVRVALPIALLLPVVALFFSVLAVLWFQQPGDEQPGNASTS